MSADFKASLTPMSTPETEVEELFARVVMLPPSERECFLAEACGSNSPLLVAVTALIKAHESAGSLESPAAKYLGFANEEAPGAYIKQYKILKKIGEGGCGVVYQVESQPFYRRLALKVIKAGMDTKQMIARFKNESQALALMDHPNIAKVFEAGASDQGRPFFVMEFVNGVTIRQFCDEHRLSISDRLRLFMQVCDAVQHAHQKRIIHRDIKPSNVLVSLDGDKGVTKVIDFGVAKATEQRWSETDINTQQVLVIGTPAYASPEQLNPKNNDIDTRADIYSLGAVLYELLTGKPPLDLSEAKNYAEECEMITRTDPLRPSARVLALKDEDLKQIASSCSVWRSATPWNQSAAASAKGQLAKALRGDLDHIVLRALEKDRTRRYASASSLASDLQRHLSHEPVVARPPSKIYRIGKTLRRNRLVSTIAAIFLMSLALTAGISTSLFFKERATARKSEYIAAILKDMLNGVGPSVALGRDISMLRDILNKTAQRLETGLANDPETEAELRLIIGSAYLKLGEFGKAEQMLRRALRLRTALFGKSDRRLADPLKYLARALINRGFDSKDLAEAETMLREALAIEDKLPEDEHLALTLHLLASALQRQNRFTDAEAIHRRALEVRARLFGSEHLDVAASLDSLALVLQRQTRFAEAEKMHRDALNIRINILGSDHPDIAVSLNNLGRALQRQKRLADAEVEFRKALELSRKFLPKDHPDLANALGDLGYLLSKLDNLTDAEALEREALTIRQRVFGKNASVAGSLYNLGKYAMTRNNLVEAEVIFQEAWSIVRPPLTDRTELQADVAEQLALIYEERAKLDTASRALAAEWKQRHSELNASARRKAK